ELDESWGRELIRAWNSAGWIDLPARVGDKIGALIGAARGSVVAGDSTSINLFKALTAALELAAPRKVILSDSGNFPTDLYVAEGVCRLLGRGHELKIVDPEAVESALDERVAALMLTEVDYRTGRRHDMRSLTAKAKAFGAVTIWDLAHSAGAFPVDLAGCGVDFAVGCGYKYLNGGPGAPAFVYVRPDLQAQVAPALSGWMGHAAPFAFELGYRPAPGVDRRRAAGPVHGRARRGAGRVRGRRHALCAGALGRAQRGVHPPHRSRLPRTRARFAALSRPAGLPSVVPLHRRLCGDAGADRAGRDRRLPRARRDALRLHAALHRFCRNRDSRTGARRDRANRLMGSSRISCPEQGDMSDIEGADGDFRARMSYGDYLRLPELLGAQAPLTDAHDELLFIIQHQTSELWMKLAIREIRAAGALIRADAVQPAFKLLARVARIFEQLNKAWDVLRTMTPSDYSEFRERLGQSSGFQSWQYRAIEFLAGNRNLAMLKPHEHRPEIVAELKSILAEPSLYQEAILLLGRRGFDVGDAAPRAEAAEPHVECEALTKAWAVVYRDPAHHWDLYELAEKLIDFEDYFRRWRFNHVTTVERVIGLKRGTGGTSGVAYLKRMLEIELFPELWRVRTRM